VLTYQLLTGELPFEGKTAGAVLMQHVHQEPPLLQSKGRGAEVPDDVARVVMRSLSKDPDARQQTLAEFLDSLAEAAGNAGLLNDARALLFGTIWGDDLAAPGSYLADLLGSSAPPSSPSPLADTQPIAVDRDPDEEALLSSAPKPFGTTSHDLAAASRPRQQNHKWLWASLGLLSLILVGVVTGALWLQREPRAIAEEPQPEPAQAPPVVVEQDAQVADIGTDVPVAEPVVVEEVVAEEPVVEKAPPPKVKPKAKKRPRKVKALPSPRGEGSVAAPGSETAPAAETVPAAETKTAAETGNGSGDETETGNENEPDDGIDWTVPDFPEDPPPPTGTPDAPPRNPVVIDEPPAQ
jgi:hypothetical protein